MCFGCYSLFFFFCFCGLLNGSNTLHLSQTALFIFSWFNCSKLRLFQSASFLSLSLSLLRYVGSFCPVRLLPVCWVLFSPSFSSDLCIPWLVLFSVLFYSFWFICSFSFSYFSRYVESLPKNSSVNSGAEQMLTIEHLVDSFMIYGMVDAFSIFLF